MVTDAFSLRPVGWGRYIEVPFFGVWIAGWLIGELVALALLGGLLAGLIAAVVGFELPFASRLAPDGSVPFFLLFILMWLTLWTVGGVAALRHFLRSLAGQDVVTVSPAGLELVWRAGPFRKRQTIPHGDIRRVRLRLNGTGLVVDTASGTVDVTDLGSRDERFALLGWLRQRLVLPDEAQARRLEAETLPPGWELETHGLETRLTRPTRRTRAIQSGILWTLSGLVLTGFLPALSADTIGGGHLAALAVGLLIVVWATWTTWGRSEWLVRHGQLTWRRRFRSWHREHVFEDAAIELLHKVDSEGDDRFTLRVRSTAARREIWSAIHDPAELASLAEWLSARTRFPVRRP